MLKLRLIRLLFAIVCTITAGASRAEIQPFTFIHFSDTHIGSGDNEAHLRRALKDVDDNFPEAAFIIVTGDTTEFGYADELEKYVSIIKSATKRAVYSAPGNHDARWSDSGKENFRRIVGDSYLSFDHNGVRFILLDSSMLLEQYAHFDGLQMQRLAKELDSLPAGHPAIPAMHHPPLSPGHFFDNEQEFARLIGTHNVPLVLTGHGHGFTRYAYNSTQYAMGGSTFGNGRDQKAYAVYDVSTTTLTRRLRRYAKNSTEFDGTFPIQRTGPIPELRQTTSSVVGSPEFRIAYPGEANSRPCTYQIDEISTGSSAPDSGNAIKIDPELLTPGIHELVATISTGPQSGDVASTEFVTRRKDPLQPYIGRTFPLLSASQSHPMVDDNVLYVAANDGFVRAIDLATSEGNVLWQRHLNSEVVSAPALTTGSVIIGSMDSHVYALDRKSGEIQWKFKTGLAVFASPLIVDTTVYIGSGDDNLYAIDTLTGKERWRFAARAHIKMTPAYAAGKLFFGAWDNTFYCVNAEDGKQAWAVPVAASPPRYSAATCNPAVTETSAVIVCSHDYSIRCFDQRTGAQNWIYKPTKEELGPSYSAATIFEGVAYFGSINGHVVGHSVDNGAKVFDVELRPGKTDAVFDSWPLLKNGKLYVGTVGGNLYCVDIAGKKVAWSIALQPSFIFTRPAVWNNSLLVSTTNNAVNEVITPGL